MDILIYGAGAVGGYLGARLTQQKHNVTLVARDVMVKLIGETGLELKEGDSRHLYSANGRYLHRPSIQRRTRLRSHHYGDEGI